MDNLESGDIRFILLFQDEALTIPLIQTLVFREECSREDGGRRFLFQDLGAPTSEQSFFVDEEEFDQLVLDIHGLVKKVSEISKAASK